MTMISPLGVTSACQFSFWRIKGIITNKGLFKYASRPNIISFTHLHKHTHTQQQQQSKEMELIIKMMKRSP